MAVRKNLGRYVVIDTDICHGQPTFRGTRILVKDVLEQVTNGVAWHTILEQWRGAVNREAIAEAVHLVRHPTLRAALARNERLDFRH